MCGIAGIIRFDGNEASDSLLQKMIDVAHHRGPDGTKRVFCGPVGLAHKRLAIIDINYRALQPMCYANRFWIVYNGEIYNYIELRTELEQFGHVFQTKSDTEVILAAYAQWGHHCLERFNGMWALAIHDEYKGEVFFARDRFGIKPLHLTWLPGMLCFGSEIKQLLPALPQRRANPRRVLDYLVTGYENHTDESFFDGIESLPSGSWMRVSIDGNVLDKQVFYRLPEKPAYSQLEIGDAIKLVADLLTDSIRLRMRSDVRVGTCLSGGLDSSAISMIASRIYHQSGGEKFIGIHAKSTERSTDESVFAQQVAKAAKIRLATVKPTSEDFAKTIDEVIYTQEEPFGSPSMFMGWHVFEEAQRQSCKVMLNGQGGDEAFLGYERYYPLELDPTNPLQFVRRIRMQANQSKLSTLEALRYYFYFRNSFLRISRLKVNRYISRRHIAKMAFDSVHASADSYTRCFALQKLEISSLQLPHLLRYEDRNSMRHSIETRLPFLDYRLMEVAASLPMEFKLQSGWTKYLLRKVTESDLPEDITWRKTKLGFEAPSTTWFNHRSIQMLSEIQASPMLAEYANLDMIIRDWNELSPRQRWALFNLAAWSRVYDVTA